MQQRRLLVRAVTWNQQAQPPPTPAALQAKLLPSERYHVYAIGTQVIHRPYFSNVVRFFHLLTSSPPVHQKECEHSIASSVVQPSKAQWEEALRRTLGPRYHAVASHTLQVGWCARPKIPSLCV